MTISTKLMINDNTAIADDMLCWLPEDVLQFAHGQ
jgi:hypothetical protein